MEVIWSVKADLDLHIAANPYQLSATVDPGSRGVPPPSFLGLFYVFPFHDFAALEKQPPNGLIFGPSEHMEPDAFSNARNSLQRFTFELHHGTF